ncbi:MAG: hypothetical protein AVDCRST_MAG59-4338, partial [uncultured Thermomicrobiales bacterium]
GSADRARSARRGARPPRQGSAPHPLRRRQFRHAAGPAGTGRRADRPHRAVLPPLQRPGPGRRSRRVDAGHRRPRRPPTLPLAGGPPNDGGSVVYGGAGVRRQRPHPVRPGAGGHPVAVRRRRQRPLVRRPAGRRARPCRHPRRRGRPRRPRGRHAGDATRLAGRRRPRPRHPAGVGDERAATDRRPRRPAPPARARLGRHRQHQVAGRDRGARPRLRRLLERRQLRRLVGSRGAPAPSPGDAPQGGRVDPGRRLAGRRRSDAHCRLRLERLRRRPSGGGQRRRRRHVGRCRLPRGGPPRLGPVGDELGGHPGRDRGRNRDPGAGDGRARAAATDGRRLELEGLPAERSPTHPGPGGGV